MEMIIAAVVVTLGLVCVSLSFLAIGRGLVCIAKALALHTRHHIEPMRVSVTPDSRRDGWNIDVKKV
jgi:hypothetical protein